jgi:hypothetical protein
MFSFGYFPGVRLSFADISEPSVRSQVHLQRLDEEGSEASAKLNLTPGKYPKENIQVTTIIIILYLLNLNYVSVFLYLC